MRLTDLPDLPPDAVGATVQGVYYTRAEYEALRARSRSFSVASNGVDVESPTSKGIAPGIYRYTITTIGERPLMPKSPDFDQNA